MVSWGYKAHHTHHSTESDIRSSRKTNQFGVLAFHRLEGAFPGLTMHVFWPGLTADTVKSFNVVLPVRCLGPVPVFYGSIVAD